MIKCTIPGDSRVVVTGVGVELSLYLAVKSMLTEVIGFDEAILSPTHTLKVIKGRSYIVAKKSVPFVEMNVGICAILSTMRDEAHLYKNFLKNLHADSIKDIMFDRF